MIIEAVKVPLTEDQGRKIAEYFVKEIEEAISQRSGMEKQWETAQKQYAGRLQREDAGPYDANIDISTTREHSQQSSARLINPIFQQDRVFTCIPRPGVDEDQSRKLEDALDWMSDKAKIQKIVPRWVKGAHIFNYCPVKLSWVTKTRTIREWATEERPVIDEFGQPIMAQAQDPMGGILNVPVTQPVKDERQ